MNRATSASPPRMNAHNPERTYLRKSRRLFKTSRSSSMRRIRLLNHIRINNWLWRIRIRSRRGTRSCRWASRPCSRMIRRSRRRSLIASRSNKQDLTQAYNLSCPCQTPTRRRAYSRTQMTFTNQVRGIWCRCSETTYKSPSARSPVKILIPLAI